MPDKNNTTQLKSRRELMEKSIKQFLEEMSNVKNFQAEVDYTGRTVNIWSPFRVEVPFEDLIKNQQPMKYRKEIVTTRPNIRKKPKNLPEQLSRIFDYVANAGGSITESEFKEDFDPIGDLLLDQLTREWRDFGAVDVLGDRIDRERLLSVRKSIFEKP